MLTFSGDIHFARCGNPRIVGEKLNLLELPVSLQPGWLCLFPYCVLINQKEPRVKRLENVL